MTRSNIVSVKSVGKERTYDLEVDHSNHQYYLHNGLLTSNSHSTLYSMISFATSWLKGNYTLEFLVSNLISEVKSNTKASKSNILKIKNELRSRKIKIVPPDINTSELSWKIIDDNTLMTGLDSLKSIGKNAIPEIIEKRPFNSFKDLIYRTDARKVNASSIKALAASGSLDSFDLDRKTMFYYVSDYRDKLRSHMLRLERAWENSWAKENNIKKAEDEIGSYWIKEGIRQTPPIIPEELIKSHLESFNYPFPKEEPWTIQEAYAFEHFYMGEGISGSVFDRYPNFFHKNKTVPFAALKQMFPWKFKDKDERTNRKANTHYLGNHKIRPIEAVIDSIFVFIVKKEDSPIFGQEMARMNILDPWNDESSLLCFPEAWSDMKNRIENELSGGKQKIEPGVAIRFLGNFQWENEKSTSFVLSDILDFKSPPIVPSDRSSRIVKIPRAKKLILNDIINLKKDEFMEVLEDEMLDNGISTII